MKNLLFLFVALLSVGIYSCEQDDVVVTDTTPLAGFQISGTAMWDNDGDGVGDVAAEGAIVYYGDSIEIGQMVWSGEEPAAYPAPLDATPFTYVDAQGNYSITDGLTESEGAVMIYYNPNNTDYPCGPKGTDTTPDGDPSETTQYDRIHLTLTTNEHDDGNNFTLTCN